MADKVAIVTPYDGKFFCFYDCYRTIESLLKNNPDCEFTWVIYDNSYNPKFKRLLDKTMQDFGSLAKIIYHYVDRKPVIPKPSLMYDIYKFLYFEKVPSDTDYILNIEDDVSCEDPKALGKMLDIFTDEKVATVIASSFARHYESWRFGRSQAWYWHNNKYYNYPAKEDGVQFIDAGAQSFWLTKYKVLQELDWVMPYGRAKSVDNSWGENVSLNGYKFAIHWGVQCKHWFRTKDDIVDYVCYGYNRKPFCDKKIWGPKKVQVFRQASPLFVPIKEQEYEPQNL